ncbi:MAG: hypothetical protein ACE5GU_05240 [Candidatus Scalinduaceae bacterium]
MFGRYFIQYVFVLTFLWYSSVFAEEDANTSAASGGNQIVVSPINILLDVSEVVSVDILVLDEDGNPIEGHKVQIIPKDKQKIFVKVDNRVTNDSGYISFSILGKQQGDTVVTVTDGAISSQINVAIRDLIHYVLPYFYGNMKLSLINPSEDINYVKIQFHENSDRSIQPVVVRLEDKEMKTLKLSEQLDIALKDGWAEIYSTEIIFGGVWTNKGYLSFKKIDE